METRAVLADCLGILCNPVIQKIGCIPVGWIDCVFWAYADTSATAHTFIFINTCLAICDMWCIMGTDSYTGSTAYTQALVYRRFAGA